VVAIADQGFACLGAARQRKFHQHVNSAPCT
jgi:hypothetical protein